ncbi:penicillin-insensitive murein endopeptidase [Noviherbaspirillum aerium]|uniref:penicillin-insensitive murein endopeptidase n=1 Tax=Noviherbaspirillum aerium TaxID=2588497 RepID=UPI00124D2304|nr:penicillin-insensitive murein endopeptidase [Noviherbaspirillum aerium]
MRNIEPKDSRGYFMLPQSLGEAGYYTYGTPVRGQGQYAHPKILSLIFQVAHRWASMDSRSFGVGNISLPGGVAFPPHKTHQSGLEVDIRPLRRDGKPLPVDWRDRQYDRAATGKLIELFLASGVVKGVLFNDLVIPRVKPRISHDNHFHLDVTL